MRKDIPEQDYWKLRSIVLEKAVQTERANHVQRLGLLLQNTQGFINELGGTLKEFGGVCEDARMQADERFNAIKADIGGAIGMEGNPEEWNVKLVDEFNSVMEQKD